MQMDEVLSKGWTVVWLNSFYDADTLSLIIDLMKELDEKHYEDD